MKVLHVIRQLDEARGLETARRQAESHDVTVLLLHDAVLRRDVDGLRAFACEVDVAARGGRCAAPLLGDDAILDLIAGCDRVITW